MPAKNPARSAEPSSPRTALGPAGESAPGSRARDERRRERERRIEAVKAALAQVRARRVGRG
jgi:hypothetical protein